MYFVWYEDCSSSFLLLPVYMEYIFHPLIFSLYVSLGLKWVSCWQHIYGSCFFIHSASLCLLVGAFNPFTFKIIIDIYVPIAIFLIVWGASVDVFSSLVFLDYISPFNMCCKAGWIDTETRPIYKCCPQETHFRPKDTYRLKMRGWKIYSM